MKTRFLVPFALLASVAGAQTNPPGRVARLNLAAGAVSMQAQATGPDWVPAQINYPLTSGDQLWTDFDAHAELHIGNTAIRLRGETSTSFILLDDQTIQLQLLSGGLNVSVRNLYPDEVFEVDTPNAAFTIRQPGDYRIDVTGQQTKIIVWAGAAEISSDNRTLPLRTRDYVVVTGYGQLGYTLMTAPAPDDFDLWSSDRDNRPQQSRNVPPDMTGAEDLDLYGSWSEVPDLGPVWTPRVDPNWSPYRVGHWVWIDPWGWTWIDDSPWGFAPFHYGRWTVIAGSWGWVPGRANQRARYSPALVGWGSTGNSSAAWFPLSPGDKYANRNVPGAVVGTSHSDMSAGRPNIGTVPGGRVPLNQVTTVAPVARPTIPPQPRGGNAPIARPPAAVMEPTHPVITRNRPPNAPTARPAAQPPSAEPTGRGFPGREAETIRPARPADRVETTTERPRRQSPQVPVTPQQPARSADRVETVERPHAQPPTRPTDQVERPAPTPLPRIERAERPTPTAERPQMRIERPTPAPERVERPINLPSPPTPVPHAESKREEKKDDKKDDKKKQ